MRYHPRLTLSADYLAAVLYDVNNHLAAILGAVDCLGALRDTSPVEEIQLLESIRQQVFRLHALCRESFKCSEGTGGCIVAQWQPLALKPVLIQAVQQWETEAQRKHLVLDLQLPAHLPLILGDPAALLLVFSNFLQNAYKFTPPHGRVTLQATWDAQTVAVRCTDTGCGIAPTELERIFERGVRGEIVTRVQGSGLGLFLVKRIVSAHGAQVTAESTVGQGSCFTVSFPIHDPERAPLRLDNGME